MKWLPLTAAALVIILAACIGVWCYLRDSAEQVCQALAGLEEALLREDWAEAEAVCERAEAAWRQARPRWAVLIDHGEMEDIDFALVSLRGAVLRKERDEASKELTELTFFLRRASEAERPDWENIL